MTIDEIEENESSESDESLVIKRIPKKTRSFGLKKKLYVLKTETWCPRINPCTGKTTQGYEPWTDPEANKTHKVKATSLENALNDVGDYVKQQGFLVFVKFKGVYSLDGKAKYVEETREANERLKKYGKPYGE